MNDMIKFAFLKALNGKSRYRETIWEGVAIGQVKDDLLDYGGGRGDRKKWLDWSYILGRKLVNLDNDGC